MIREITERELISHCCEMSGDRQTDRSEKSLPSSNIIQAGYFQFFCAQTIRMSPDKRSVRAHTFLLHTVHMARFTRATRILGVRFWNYCHIVLDVHLKTDLRIA